MNKPVFSFAIPNPLKIMPSGQSRESLVGLDFNHSRVMAVELDRASSGKPLLSKLVSEPLQDGQSGSEPSTEPLSWAPSFLSTRSLEAFWAKSKLSSPKVNIAISGPVVLTRFIPFPRMSLRELRAAMQYEIEKYIPFESGDVIADYHILSGDGQDKKNMKVILVAAKKTEISSLINLFRKAHVQIRIIDIHAFACFNAFTQACPEAQKNCFVLLDIGTETCSLMVIADNEPAFIREISLGSADILDTFRKKSNLPEIPETTQDLQTAVTAQPAYFREAADALVSQIRLSLNYFAHNNPKIETPKVLYLSGELSPLKEFQADLSRVLEIRPELWDCLKNIELANGLPKDEIDRVRHLLPISVGLALRSE